MEENKNLENNLEPEITAQGEQTTIEQPAVEQPSTPVNPYIVSSDYNANGQYQPVVSAPLLNQKNTTNHGMAIASMVLGIVGTVLCCCCGTSVVIGIIGLILGIIARSKGNREVFSLVGIILNSVAIFLSIALVVYYIIAFLSDPEAMNELLEVYDYYGIDSYGTDSFGTESSYYFYDNDYYAALRGLIK